MNNYKPFLSVIVPIYSVEEYLPICIESIIHQTYRNLEIILVDDGATGSEPRICDEYAQIDSRISVIHKKNAGLVEARKSGLQKATSQYVTFVDGDDYLSRDHYEQMMNRIILDNPDLLATNYTSIENGNEKEEIQCIPDGIYETNRLFFLFSNMNCYKSVFYDFGIWPSVWTKIYRTELLRSLSKDIPSSIRMGEDCAFTFPYILNCKKVVVDNSIKSYYYRILSNSMSRTVESRFIEDASQLFHYLRPYYNQMNMLSISNQFEYLRASYQKLILTRSLFNNRWFEIPKAIDCFRVQISQSSLFTNSEAILYLRLPKETKNQLRLISKSKWKKLKVYCIFQNIKNTIYQFLKKSFQ